MREKWKAKTESKKPCPGDAPTLPSRSIVCRGQVDSVRCPDALEDLVELAYCDANTRAIRGHGAL